MAEPAVSSRIGTDHSKPRIVNDMKTLLLRLSGFTLLPLLSLITPLLLLPIISTLVGSEGVSSVISGQAIGTFAATVLMWGWNVDGPVAIAQAPNATVRGQIYAQSVRTRLLLLVAILPISGILASIIAVPEFRVAAISMTWATLFAGMSPAWFCIGLGRPRLLALFDTVPRFLSTAVAALLIVMTQEIWPLVVVTFLITTGSLIIFHRNYASGNSWLPTALQQTMRDITQQKHTAGINLAGSAYASTPTPIATATTPPALSGSLSTADTLYRFGIFTIVSLGNALQSWTIEQGVSNRKRHLGAIWAHSVLGVVGATILTLLGPWASSIIFAGQIEATRLICFYYGLAFFFLSTATPFIRNLLIPARKQRLILSWTVVSAIVGVAGMLWAGLSENIEGVALGMAASEAILCAALIGPGLKVMKNERILRGQ